MVFICKSCGDKLRGMYGMNQVKKNQGVFGDNTLHTEDELRDVKLQDVINILRQREAEQTQLLGENGNSFTNLFKVEEIFTIAPKPMEVGIFRAKAYKDRRVVRGTMVKGSFNQKDTVMIQSGETPFQVQILELIPCDGINFMDNLKANIHKKTVMEGFDAWLVLDMTVDIPVGTMICR